MNIPKEYKQVCNDCGESYDARNIGEVAHHGFGGCMGEEPFEEKQYSTSRKVGEPIEWTKNRQPINVN